MADYDFFNLCRWNDKVLQRKAEHENARAQFERARTYKNIAYLIFQYEPVATLGLDRERLRIALTFVVSGDLDRVTRELTALQIEELKKKGNI